MKTAIFTNKMTWASLLLCILLGTSPSLFGQTDTLYYCTESNKDFRVTLDLDSSHVTWWMSPSNLATGLSTSDSSYHINFGNSAGTFTLFAQEYSVNNCPGDTQSIVIVIYEFNITADIFPVSCFNGSDGSVSVSVVPIPGQTFSYQWGTTSTDSSISGVPQGSYSLNISTNSFCSIDTTFFVPQPDSLFLIFDDSPILCNGGTSNVVLTAYGGTTPYNGVGNFVLNANSYSYTVTDSNGCIETISFTIQEPPSLMGTADVPPILCYGDSTIVSINANGGTVPYSGTGNFPTIAGNYSYIISDANGCQDTLTVAIGQPDSLEAIVSFLPILCHGGTTTLSVSATGGTGPYFGTGTFAVSAGPYSYSVTDSNGCPSSTSTTVGEPPVLVAAASNTPISCNGGNSTITVTATGGTGPYSGTGNFTYAAGTYSFGILDNNGCTDSIEINITQPDSLLASWNPQQVCPGDSTQITINISGGTPSYWITSSVLSLNQFPVIGTNFTTPNQISSGTPIQFTVGDSHNCESIFSFTIQTYQTPITNPITPY